MNTKASIALLLALVLAGLPERAEAGDTCVVTPDTVTRGNVEDLTVSGLDFSGATGVSVDDSRVTVLDVDGTEPDLAVSLQIGQRAVAGTRDLTVSFSVADDILCSDAFTIVPGQPELFQLQPDQVTRGDSQTLVVQGLNLDAITNLSIGEGVQTADYVVAAGDPTEASVGVTVADDAGAGLYDVIGLTGGIDAVLQDGFEVVPGELGVTAVSPDAVTRGETLTLQVDGANLDVVQTVSLGSGVSIGAIDSQAANELSVVVSAQQDAVDVGTARDLVLSGGGQTAALADSVTVNAGATSLTRVQPGVVSQGNEVELRLDGINLDGLDSFDAGESVTASSFDVLAPTRVLVDVTIDEEAAPGLRDVEVSGTYGTSVLVGGLRIVESIVPDPRVNFPSVIDAGQVEVGSRKRISMIFINEVEVAETVELEILSGDIDEFKIVDATGMTLNDFYPNVLSFELLPRAERLVGIEFRPTLRSTSIAELQVVVRGEELGRVDLRGTGIATTLSFTPTPPVTLPIVQEGETASRQISTLSSTVNPPEIESVELLVERNNAPFDGAEELTTVRLSDPLPPETRRLFGTTLMTLETSYPAGSYEGEIWLLTSRSSTPIVPLVFTATVTPAPPMDGAEGDEPADAGDDMGADVADDGMVDTGDTGAPDATGDVDEPDGDAGGLDADEGGGGEDSGCCAQAATSREPSESWLLVIGLLALGLIRRRR